MLRIPQWLIVFWPYLLAALVTLLWLAVLRKRIARKLEFIGVAFVACTVANMAVEFSGDEDTVRVRLVGRRVSVLTYLCLAE